MSERAYQHDRLAAGLEPDPSLTKPGNERCQWRVKWTPSNFPNSFAVAYFQTFADADEFTVSFPATSNVTIERV